MSKNFLQSKTIQGILISALPYLSNLVGYEIPDHAGFVNDILILVGSVWAIYGRVKAVDKIKLVK